MPTTDLPFMIDRRMLADLLLDQNDEYAFTFLDVNGNFIDWSAGAAKIYGYSREEVLGKSAAMIFTPGDRARGIFDHELAVARAGGNMEDDRWMMRKDGQCIWVTGILKALRDEQGNVIAFSKTMRNRTDLKTRTDSLESEINSLKSKDQRNRRLVAVLAHELRNSIAPVMNATQLLQLQLGQDTELSPLVEIQERQMNTLVKLVADLFDATRVTEGKVHCEKIPVDLTQILQRVAEFARPELEARQHHFWLHLPPTSIVVEGDPVRLQQVFTNLLGNAIKYTPNGGNIYLRATRDGDAIVTVEDNGIGIPPEVLPQIFELFTQEDDPEQRTRTGLGIGLALVKDLVGLHGGTVQARSDGRDKGSIFMVQLPLAKSSPS